MRCRYVSGEPVKTIAEPPRVSSATLYRVVAEDQSQDSQKAPPATSGKITMHLRDIFGEGWSLSRSTTTPLGV